MTEGSLTMEEVTGLTNNIITGKKKRKGEKEEKYGSLFCIVEAKKKGTNAA